MEDFFLTAAASQRRHTYCTIWFLNLLRATEATHLPRTHKYTP